MLIDDVPLDHPVVAHEFSCRLQAYHRQHAGLCIWCAERLRAPLSAAELAEPELLDALSPAALRRLATPVPRFAGWFNLMCVPEALDEVELGCRLMPHEFGTGLVDHRCARLLDHAFERLRLPRVFGFCHPAHRSAGHALAVLGFESRGERRYGEALAQAFVIEPAHWRRAAAARCASGDAWRSATAMRPRRPAFGHPGNT